MINLKTIMRRPSAFLPVMLSLLALTLVCSYVALFGVIHQTDEGDPAHLWQILMAVQIPIIAFFLIKYVPQRPKQALLVLTLQIQGHRFVLLPCIIGHDGGLCLDAPFNQASELGRGRAGLG